MKIINHGENFEIYGDSIQTFDNLPTGTYKIDFHPMKGFSLVQADNFEAIEEKIYGNHLEKIAKIFNSYNKMNRSLGIILSGDKGMGKSLAAQLLAEEAVSRGIPVIIVSHAIPGTADFIEKIDQQVLVLFDEFEKVFSLHGDKGEPQTNFLGLFDGTSQTKRMYVITVNNLNQLSDYMLSRTGRFHYHLRFDYPSPAEIEEYLKDKLEPEYHNEIIKVIAFSSRVKLNYDSLRAIAFELNLGYSFNSAISDLNILTTERQRFDLKIAFSNGKVVNMRNYQLNLFDESIRIDNYDNDWFTLNFSPNSIQTTAFNEMFVNGRDVELDYNANDSDWANTHITSIEIKHHQDAHVNYKMLV